MSVNTNTDLNQGEHNHFDLIEIKNPKLPYERNIDGFGNGHFLKLTGWLQSGNKSRSMRISFLLKNSSEAGYITVSNIQQGNFSLKITNNAEKLQVNDEDYTRPISNSNMVAKFRIIADFCTISQMVLTPSTNIAIIPHNFPIRKMSEDIVGKLQTAILGSIKLISNQKDTKMGFDEFTYNNGYLKIICASVDTRIWLEKLLKALPLWKSEKLQIVNLNEVPIEKKCYLYLQGQNINSQTLLRTISAQTSVHIDFLDVLDADIGNNGTKYHLLMDMVTWNKLNGHIYYGLSRIPLLLCRNM